MQQESKKKKKRPQRTRAERIYRFMVKWPKRIVILFFFLLFVLFALIQLPIVQNYLKDQTIAKLRKELKTEISISGFKFSIFNGFYLNDLYIEDLNRDTLFYAQKVQASLNQGVFSLINNELDISKIELNKARVNLFRHKDSLDYNAQFILDYFKPKKKKNKSNKLKLALEKIQLDQIHFSKRDDKNKKNFVAFVHQGQILIDSINLNTNVFAIQGINLTNPSFSTFKHKDYASPPKDTTTQSASKPNLTLIIKDLVVKDGRFSSDDFSKSITRDTVLDVIDFKHLQLTKINIDIQDFSLDSATYTGQINHLSLLDQTGFEIERLTAKNVKISSDEILLNDFSLKTPEQSKRQQGTYLQKDLAFKYNSFKDFKSFKEDVFIKAKLIDSRIAIRDLLFFGKKLKNRQFFKLNKDKVLRIQGDLYGKVKNPRANNLIVSLGNISLIGKIKANDIFNREHVSINLDVKQLKTDIQTIQTLFPKFNPPKSLLYLGNLNFKGKFEGFFNNFVAYGELTTDIGTVIADMNLDITNGTERATYSGDLSVINFDLGTWFQNKKLGRVTFSSSVKEGGGIRLKTAHATLEGAIKNLVFKDYQYKDIFLKGKLEKNFFSGQLASNTKDLDFDFNGTIDFTDIIAKYNFDSKVRKLNLYKLNLAKKPLNITGEFALNLTGKNIKELAGHANFKNVRLVDKTDSYKLDSAVISLDLSRPTNRFLVIKSSLINAELTGSFDLPSIPKAIKADLILRNPTFSRKLNIKNTTDTIKPQNFEYTINIPSTLNITKLLNINIDTFKNVSLTGKFDSEQHIFDLNASIGGVYLGGKAILNTILDVKGSNKALTLNGYIFETQLNSRRSIPPISLKIKLFPDTLDFRIKSSNISNVLKNIRINGVILPKDDYYQLHFNPSKIQIAQDLWKIDSDNYLRFSKKYLEAKNISFVSENRKIELTTPTNNSLNLDLKNFDLSFINSLYNYPNFQYTGPFVANIQFKDIRNKKDLFLKMDADTLNINNLSHGRFKLRAHMPNFKSPLDVQLNIGKKNHLAVGGFIHFGKTAGSWKGKLAPPKSIYLNGELNDFPFNIMEDIIPSGISETAGVFEGKIKIEGPLTGPEFDGYANIKTGEITIDYLKTHYFINNQTIKITTTKFDATGQLLEDKYGNKAFIEGGLTHRRFNHFGLNVKIRSDKFLILDTKKGDNPLYYGRVLARAFAGFSGDFNQPNLRVIGTSLKNTDLKLLFTDEKQIGETNFVKFVSFQKEKETVDVKEDKTSTAKGLDIDMQLELTEDADIQLIFDEISGDIIKSQGTGNFNIGYKRSGEFTMNGQYVITKGQYLFTLLNFINKPFIIEPGGTITWRKDPMKAELNIQALYRGLSAPVYSLIKEELTSIGTSADIEDAQRPSAIDLGLILTGPMLQPSIAFTLDIKNLIGNNKNYVANKLSLIQNDPNELNRQVFGLLVFGGFLPPGNSLGLEESSALKTGIASTISELLSSQFALYVNSLLSEIVGTGRFYSGMEVDIGLNIYQTYQTTGGTVPNSSIQSKAFQFNLKNHFFNNRVTIQVGGNVGLDENQINPAATSDFSGDILIEIILSKNRRYRMQIYNRFAPDYSGTTRNRMKSGFGLSYQREFNSFEDLFKGLKRNLRKKKN